MSDLDESTADPFQLCGTTIEGKYRIAKVIGDGGFGVVYRGVHTGFGEIIAVKCLKLPHALDEKQREGFLEQLRDEGRLLHRLSKATPGIVQALDVGAVTTPSGQWVPYLVLEWLEGETLADTIQARLGSGKGPYPLEEAIRLIEPAARALAVAHAMKVAHRDVKPHNLFVTQGVGGTTLKVLDFGIAKVLTDYPTFTRALEATKAAPTAFTPRYGAPEQFNKTRGATGPWTDVFALSLILVELLTGKKALEGDDPTQLYIAAADPMMRPTPNARGASVPDAVERVLARALSVEPKDRHADAGEFFDDLLAAAGLTPALQTARPVSSSRSAATGPLSSEPPTVAEGAKDRTEKTPELDVTQPAEAVKATKLSSVAGAGTGAAPAKPAANPMSETPFFERHHLPPSKKSAAPSPAPAEKASSADSADPPAKRGWGGALLALLVIGGAAAGYVYFTGEDKPPHPLTIKGNPLPSASHKPTAPPRASASASAAHASSASPPAGDAGPAVSAEPGTPPVDMVQIAPGTFKMGEGADARDVTLTHGFWIDRTEVTTRAYEACVTKRQCSAADHVALAPGVDERWGPPAEGDAGPTVAVLTAYADVWTRRCNAPRGGADDHPINCVDFASAEAYCKFAGKRLPTEAEWEFAARGTEGRAYAWGADHPECGRTCYDKNSACFDKNAVVATCAAGLHPADRTPEGVYDMGGDVAEWVSDGFAEKLPGGSDPRGPTSAPLRVVRGGSFFDGDDKLRATTRAGAPPALAHVSIGFRCAMDAK